MVRRSSSPAARRRSPCSRAPCRRSGALSASAADALGRHGRQLLGLNSARPQSLSRSAGRSPALGVPARTWCVGLSHWGSPRP
eukprot:7169668-Alexandrium_andersonii.AAC.1